MYSVSQWVKEPIRRPWWRHFRLAAIVVLLLMLSCRLFGHERERRVLWSSSPTGALKAVLFETEGFGPTVAGNYIVRLEGRSRDGRPMRPKDVWKAYSLVPVHLEWHTDDSLMVVVPARELRKAGASSIRFVKKGGLRFVGTVPREMSDSLLMQSPGYYRQEPRGWDDAPGVEDR